MNLELKDKVPYIHSDWKPSLCLPPNMEKYRSLLENQHILAELYYTKRDSYKLAKNRAEKKRWTENQKLLKSKAIIDAKSIRV
jgi:hypothetical protein